MDYRNTTLRFVDLGLNLRDTPDKVGEGQWIDLTNVRSTQEGFITLREGNTLFVETLLAFPHTARRLDPATLIVGGGNFLFHNSDVYTDPVAGGVFSGFSGNPLSLVPFKAPDASAPWMFVGDSLVMKKADAAGNLYQWGGEAPNTVATAVAAGAGALNSSVAGAVTYRWRYIYRSSTSGARTNPSPLMPVGVALTNQQADVTCQGTNDPQFDQIELYRQGGVNTDATYRFVASATNTPGLVVIRDNVADSVAAVGEPLLLTRFRPFQSSVGGVQTTVALPYVWGPFQNFLLACGDPNRPGYLYWTNQADPDSADVVNNVQITSQVEELLNGFVYDLQPFVWSRENLYRIDYGVGVTTFRGTPTACGRGLATPWAFCVGPQIFFLSQDGIYVTDGRSPAVSITEENLRPIFNGLAVGEYTPVDFDEPTVLRLSWAGQELYFTYQDTAGEQQVLSWHAQYKRWRRWSYDLAVAPGFFYDDENQAQIRILLPTSGGVGQIVTTALTDAGSTIEARAQTGYFDFGAPQTLKVFGNVIVDADPTNGDIEVEVFFDNGDVVGPTFTLTGTGRQKFPLDLADTYAYNVSFVFSFGTGAAVFPAASLYQAEVQWHQDEERVGHWQYPATTHGLSGWQQLRDGYIDLDSTGVVRLTVTIDGSQVDTYDIPSTGGLRLKRYVKFAPRKGKVFEYELNGVAGATFLLYGEDCELRLKPWNTNLGYALLSPFKGSAA